MHELFVTVNGLKTHYWQAGETGSPVVLLHGGGTDSARHSPSGATRALPRRQQRRQRQVQKQSPLVDAIGSAAQPGARRIAAPC